MTVVAVPAWLEVALRRMPDRGRSSRPSPLALEPGLICVADTSSTGERSLVVVASIERAVGVEAAHCFLLSNELECATDADFLLPSLETGLPYDLLVQWDVEAIVLPERLRPIGHAPARVVDLLAGDSEDPPFHALQGQGLPIAFREARAGRSLWKREQGSRALALTEDVIRRVESLS